MGLHLFCPAGDAGVTTGVFAGVRASEGLRRTRVRAVGAGFQKKAASFGQWERNQEFLC